jgi:hypothetical protein
MGGWISQESLDPFLEVSGLGTNLEQSGLGTTLEQSGLGTNLEQSGLGTNLEASGFVAENATNLKALTSVDKRHISRVTSIAGSTTRR